MVCRITGTSIDIETRLEEVVVGSEVCLGIRASEILLSSSAPAMVSACNVIRGSIKRCERDGATTEVRVSCGGEFCVRLPSRSVESFGLNAAAEVWMMIGTQACKMVRPDLSPLRRLFVFVCRGNTSRSPMAQAICNAEIARRFGVPLKSLDKLGIKAVSAGLSARPGEPLAPEAEQALAAIGMPGVEHRSANLTHRIAQKAEVIFCMTEEQRNELISTFPEAASKIHCLQPLGDIDDPAGKGPAAFAELARLLQRLIGERLRTLGVAGAA